MSNNFLKQARQEQKMGQSQLAKKAGISRQMIWGYENGKYEISADILKKLSSALNVDSSYINNGKTSNIINSTITAVDQDKMMDAIRTTNEFYKNYNFDQETLLKIAIEIYNLTAQFNEIDQKNFDKLLNDKIILGLAAKCFNDLNKNI